MKSKTLKRIKAITAVIITAVILNTESSLRDISAETEKTKVIVNVPVQNGISLEETAENCGVEVTDIFQNLDCFSALADPYEIEKLRSIFGDENVTVSHRYTLPKEPEIKDTETAELMSAVSSADGEGSVIAVIDNGFLAEHDYFDTDLSSPKLSEEYVSSLIARGEVKPGRYYSEKIPFIYDYCGNDTDVKGIGSHGTHVSGIAGGKVEKSRRGTAPGAQLLLMKVFNDETGGAESDDILKAINDAVTLGADVINLSLGMPCGSSMEDETVIYENAFLKLKERGISVCVSAGNAAVIGKTYYGGKYPTTDIADYGTISTPACADSAIAVSALTNRVGRYEIADYSSWGVTPGLKLKPDVCAVGTSVSSSTATSVASYGNGSGTSMSAPVASGTIAAVKPEIKNKFPYMSDKDAGLYAKLLTVNTAEILLDTDETPLSPRAQGAGKINMSAAAASPAVLYTDNYETKINLYDKLGGSETFSFKAENLTDNSVVYNIKGDILTDEYTVINGKKYVNGETDVLKGADISFDCGESVELAPREVKEITATLTFDAAETERLSEVFTNGFYAEGFISLYNGTDPGISIPFLGFKGRWTDQCTFDKDGLLGDYDVLYDGVKIPVYNIDGEEPFVAVAVSGKKIRIERIHALRNYYQTIAVMENLSGREVGREYAASKGARKAFWDSGRDELPSVTTTEVPLKRSTFFSMSAGEYYYNVYSRGEYKGGLEEYGAFRLKTVIDLTSPSKARLSALKVYDGYVKWEIAASDNFGIKSAKTDSGRETDVMAVTRGGETRFETEECGGITLYDFAGNSKVFTFNNLEPCFVCGFDGAGNLKWIKTAKVPIVNGAPSYELDKNTRIFIWDNNMRPKY